MTAIELKIGTAEDGPFYRDEQGDKLRIVAFTSEMSNGLMLCLFLVEGGKWEACQLDGSGISELVPWTEQEEVVSVTVSELADAMNRSNTLEAVLSDYSGVVLAAGLLHWIKENKPVIKD